jgi:hypothetical protein
MFRMYRIYSVASLICVIGAAGAMAIMYRSVAVQSIIAVGENSNLTIAEIALEPIRPQLTDFLDATAKVTGDEARSLRLPREIDETVVELMRNPRVRRIKFYNREGTVVFSTKSSQIGQAQEDNDGFARAMRGTPAVEMVYRDRFNVFDKETEEDNLVQSYIPVRRRPTEPVAGVFEIYTDVNSLVAEAERADAKLLAITILILAALYAMLLMIVRKARDIIDSQQQTIRDKNAALEELSRRNLRREERERKKAADDLHEGLAQTLSAIKLSVEAARDVPGADQVRAEVLNSVIPSLQQAIGQARSIAMDLRPPSLDDLGLAATLNASLREFAQLHPALQSELKVLAPEEMIPAPLKSIVYRNVEAALRIISDRYAAGKVYIELALRHRRLVLSVDAHGEAAGATGAFSPLAADSGANAPISSVRDRTIISGGDLAIARDDAKGIAFRASWPV